MSNELYHISEQLATIAERLERILAMETDLLSEQRAILQALHPAESDRRSQMIIAQTIRQLETLHALLERRLTIRYLSTTALFGFMVAVITWFGK
ncbi:MAG: hypothetical protein N2450_07780 [bacterium]|nr:hypothetical protein [bacterium]